jgi:hypothetical protein
MPLAAQTWRAPSTGPAGQAHSGGHGVPPYRCAAQSPSWRGSPLIPASKRKLQCMATGCQVAQTDPQFTLLKCAGTLKCAEDNAPTTGGTTSTHRSRPSACSQSRMTLASVLHPNNQHRGTLARLPLMTAVNKKQCSADTCRAPAPTELGMLAAPYTAASAHRSCLIAHTSSRSSMLQRKEVKAGVRARQHASTFKRQQANR